MQSSQVPLVLIFAGNDPTGGAGIQADIQTVTSLGCHPVPVITAVTAQDTAAVKQFSVVAPELVLAQARAVLEDMPIAAFKTGMLGNTEVLDAVASVVEDYPDIPLIVDPVFASNTGDPLAEAPMEGALRARLVPHTTIITPNCLEARLLVPEADTFNACAQGLLAAGCQYVLLTGTHEITSDIINRLYGEARLLKSFTCKRLPGEYHGSGCTLASAVAANIALGLGPVNAVANALDYTWNTLKHGFRPGMGQKLPDRQYWARDRNARRKPING